MKKRRIMEASGVILFCFLMVIGVAAGTKKNQHQTLNSTEVAADRGFCCCRWNGSKCIAGCVLYTGYCFG